VFLEKQRSHLQFPEITPMHVLSVNSGSSSLKFAMYDAGDDFRRLFSGRVEAIGTEHAVMSITAAGGEVLLDQHCSKGDHQSASGSVFEWIKKSDVPDPDTLGHRIVHGGPRFSCPEILTESVLTELGGFVPYAPQHLPQALETVELSAAAFPHALQVACFDTAFHRSMPDEARLYPLPSSVRRQGIERYGFHGLSYQYLMKELQHIAGRDVAHGRVLLAHLGHGASMAAVCNGRSVDTTMGFSPAGGFMMSTRSGDLDPGVLLFLLEKEHLDTDGLRQMVNRHSGMLGISGSSGDMRTLLDVSEHDERAALAVRQFCYQASKAAGALTVSMGGIDTLVFSGGIGEHSSAVREMICNRLGFLGIAVDPARNRQHLPLISSESSRVEVRVIPTDEELMIARLAGGMFSSGQRSQ
jgi:acetate kinase